MIINGIEYNIRLYVDDKETEKEITEEIFDDFFHMNAFLERTWRLPEYTNAKAEYAFVEVVNGKPDIAGRYGFELSGYMPMEEEEIEDVLFEMEVTIPQEQEDMKALFDRNQVFKPDITGMVAGDESKDIPLSEYAYLCHKCLNEIKACTCQSYPMYAIQIDRLLVPVIKELNSKGYLTSSCCAGHPGYMKNTTTDQFIYVSFRERYHFPISFPEGSKYRMEGDSLCFDLPEDGKEWDAEILRKYQKECIAKFLIWAQALKPRLEDEDSC